MTLFTDTFAGSDGTTLNGRSGWTKFGSGANDNPMLNGSSQLKTGGADSTDAPLQGQDHGNADHFVQINWSANAIDRPPLLVVRAVDRNTMAGAYYDNGAGRWRTYASGIGNMDSAVASAPTTSTVVRLKVVGTTYSLYVDDMDTALVVSTLSHASFDTNTICGLWVATATAQNPVLAGPYYSGLIADIGGIGGGGGGTFSKIVGQGFRLAGPGGGLAA